MVGFRVQIINCIFALKFKNMILEKIEELLKEVSTISAKNAEEVEQLRLKYLSKKGEINALMSEFRNVAADQKKTVGIKINELKAPCPRQDQRNQGAAGYQRSQKRRYRLNTHCLPNRIGHSSSVNDCKK